MSANTVYCHILGDNVTVVTNLNGEVTNVVCPKFWRFNHGCRKKNDELGFIGSVLAKGADKITGSRASYCEFGDPNHFSFGR
jgi:hypothetical protein